MYQLLSICDKFKKMLYEGYDTDGLFLLLKSLTLEQTLTVQIFGKVYHKKRSEEHLRPEMGNLLFQNEGHLVYRKVQMQLVMNKSNFRTCIN